MEITPDLLLQAYRIGVFPMGERRDDPKLYWLDPRLRAVLPLDGLPGSAITRRPAACRALARPAARQPGPPPPPGRCPARPPGDPS